MPDNKPNILYLHCHDAGRYIEPFGFGSTPNLLKFARQGVLFRNNYCAAPTCSASRASLLTGMAPHSNGMFGLAHLGWKLNDYKQHIIHTLHDQGYHSALAGVQHVASFEDKNAADIIGYKEQIERLKVPSKGPHHHGNADRGIAAGAAEWLKNRKSEEPFFLAVGFIFPHRKYMPAEPENNPKEDPRYIQPPRPLPDTPEVRQDIANYAASVRVMDEAAGTVLDALEESGHADNTLVIATTDHGIAFPYMKANLTDHGCGTYLMFRGPGLAEGRVSDALTSHIDVFPTVCDILGIDHPDWLQGQSLLPILKGKTDEVNEQIFVENTFHAAYEPMRGIRTKRYKYILKYDEEWKKTVQPNCDDGLSKHVWQEYGWGNHEQPFTQLYDLIFDPNEINNLAGNPEYADIEKDLKDRLQLWMEKTEDKLLDGPVPLIEGGKMWPVDMNNLEDLPKEKRGRAKFMKDIE